MRLLLLLIVVSSIAGCFNGPNSPEVIASKIRDESYCKGECSKVGRELEKIKYPFIGIECECKGEVKK